MGQNGDGPRFRYSFSAVDTFLDRCRRAFLYDREKRTSRGNIWRAKGDAGHSVMAEYNEYRVDAEVRQDLPKLREVAARLVRLTPGLPSDSYPEVLEVCETAAIAQGDLDYAHVVEVENPFEISVDRYEFRGKRDLTLVAGTHAQIVDYKYSHRIARQSVVDESLQLKLYSWSLLRERPEVESVTPSFLYMPSGVIRTPSTAPWYRDDLADVEGELLTSIEVIEAAEEFPCDVGSYCGICGYDDICPAVLALDADAPERETLILGPEDATRVAGAYHLTEIRQAARKAALEEWCVPHGRVIVGDLEFGFSTTHKREFDTAALLREFSDLGFDERAVLRIDAKALDKFVAREGTPALVEAVKRHTKDKSYSRFGKKKVTREDGE
jgi:hypothetical protein